MALYVNAIGKVRWDLLLCSHRSPSQGSSWATKKEWNSQLGVIRFRIPGRCVTRDPCQPEAASFSVRNKLEEVVQNQGIIDIG